MTPSSAMAPTTHLDRDDLALEVRVRWGADLLSIAHLSPMRSFHVGDGGDLALDTTPLGAPSWPIALVRGGVARVIVPRGAAGRVERGARAVTIEQAIEDGLAAPSEGSEGGPDAREIKLDLDTRVTLSLPLRAASSAYRASRDEGDASSTPVIFEIAVVRAGRVIGRGISLRPARRTVVSALVAIAIVLGVRAWDPWAIPACDGDCDAPNDAVALFLHRQIMAAAEKEQERDQEALDEAERAPDATTLRWTWQIPDRPYRRWAATHWAESAFDLERPFDPPHDHPLFPAWVHCENESEPVADRALVDFPSPQRVFCDSPLFSPFGMRVLGAPPNVDVLGRDPTDAWSELYARAIRAAPPVTARGAARVEATIVGPHVGVDHLAVERLLHARRGAIRDCVALARRHDPALTEAAFEVSLLIGKDGLLTSAVTMRRVSAAVDKAARCLEAALIGARISPAPARANGVQVRLSLRAAPAGGAR